MTRPISDQAMSVLPLVLSPQSLFDVSHKDCDHMLGLCLVVASQDLGLGLKWWFSTQNNTNKVRMPYKAIYLLKPILTLFYKLY